MKEAKSGVIYAMKKVGTTQANRRNTIREIEILSKLDHENIVRLVDYEVKPLGVNMVFEFCETNLEKYLADAVFPLNRQNVKTIASMVLSALKEIHSRGIIHRVSASSPVLNTRM